MRLKSNRIIFKDPSERINQIDQKIEYSDNFHSGFSAYLFFTNILKSTNVFDILCVLCINERANHEMVSDQLD